MWTNVWCTKKNLISMYYMLAQPVGQVGMDGPMNE